MDNKILKLIKKANKIAVFPSPIDPDSIGGSLALMLILRKMGKQAEVVSSFSDISEYKALPGFSDIRIADVYTLDFSKYDLGFFLDGGPLNRFYEVKKHPDALALPAGFPAVVIDHHPEDPFTPNYVKDINVSSTCELIYDLFNGSVEFDKDIATNLYIGISGDTGGFKFANTTAKTMRAAADLLEKGVDIANLLVNLYETVPYRLIMLRSGLIAKVKLNEEFHYAYLAVEEDYWHKEKVSLEEIIQAIENVRDQNMRSIAEVDFVFNIIEEEKNYIRGSFRSRYPRRFNLAILARILGGGGHPEAAGFKITGKSIEEAEQLVHQIIKENYAKIKLQ